MANLFVLNSNRALAPLAADKNASRLIALAVDMLAGDSAPIVPEPLDVGELRASLFTRVASGEVSALDAATELKAIDQRVADAAKAAKTDPPVLMLEGVPASAAEIKRAFRGADSGTSLEIVSFDGNEVGAITMFRV